LRHAVVSDIHGNIHALKAVLEDIKANNVDKIMCLGDVVGYGPKPRSCLSEAFDFDLVLMGNHEEAVLYGALGFNDKARQAIEWTKQELMSAHSPGNGGNEDENRKMWDFIGGLQISHTDGEFLFVHGSPREPTREYIFIQDRFDHQKMNDLFAAFDKRVCFVGHTHIPGVFEEPYSFVSLEDCACEYTRNDKKVILNVGSVGLPRDGDPRACYVLVDEHTITFRRVEYAIEKTLAEFAETPLPEYLSRRLREGR
jgi:predicted phosphodiesterase